MKLFKLPQTLILDLKKWRCGRGGPKECNLGRGATKLLNKYGKMCCLGQFADQAGIPRENILDVSMPNGIIIDSKSIILEKFSDIIIKAIHYTYDTKLTNECVSINDSKTTTINKKIKLLREILKKNGLKLKVLNRKILKEKK